MRISDWSSDVCSSDLSVLPKETEYGRKREIDQSNCNKDYSCVKGFCPSFVTVHDAPLRKRERIDPLSLVRELPAPRMRSTLDQPWNILITGVGGTGVVRSEEHTSELQSLMRISYAVFCLKKKKQ